MAAAHPAAPGAAFCRVTVLAPRCRVDVALPADVPVAELVPMALELVGEPVFGLRSVPWRLSGVAGGPFPPGATLAELGIPHGELLRLAPDSPPPPPPVFDDPVDALAATAGGGAPADRRFAAAAVLVVAAAAAALIAGWPIDADPLGAVVLGGVAASGAVVLAGGLARRAAAAVRTAAPAPGPAADDPATDPGRLHLAARTAALAAVPLAAATGWVALPSTSGAAPVLLAAAAAGTAAAAAQIALRVVAPVLVGTVVTAVPVGLGALAVLRFGAPPPAVAASLGALALVAGPLLPRAALRLAGLPRPVVPADGAELVGADTGPDVLPPEEFAERSDLARGYLAGLVGGAAVVAAGASIPAAAAGGWAGPALAGVTAAALAIRARGYADPAPARTQLACAIAAGTGLAVLLVTQTPPVVRLLAAGALLVVVAAGAIAIGRTRPAGTPVARRALDLLEGLLVAAAVPLALAATGLFQLVRGS